MSNIRRPQTDQAKFRALTAFAVGCILTACSVSGSSSDTSDDDTPEAGRSGSGVSKGGSPSTGGSNVGGRPATGGTTAKGGTTSSGGTGGTTAKGGSGGKAGNTSVAGAGSGSGNRKLVWREEFDGPAGSGPNTAVWNYEQGTGQDGWGNGELQFYTNRRKNSYLDGESHLVIEAFAEQFSGSAYTSARIHTRGRFSRLYGRFEASIKAPIGGKGVWPAFWLLGDSIGGEGWPECGEIDIMEQRGSAPLLNVGSAHGPEMFSIDAWSRTYALPSGQPYSSGFHVFAIEWEAGQVRWEVDGKIFHSMTTADLETNGKRWVFDGPMFILLNLAVGGKFDGDPNGSTPFPQKMLIDYVRVYE